jgi:hydroxymethylbilane synthase
VRRLRIGSRGSALALWQAEFVREWLARRGAAAEIVRIRTSGDHFQQASVAQIGRKGVFIKEIEDALLGDDVDLAIHSLKDVPTEIPAGLDFPAFPRREDPRDCLISRSGRTLADLPRGARIATGSLRRQAQLRKVRPDLEMLEVRGNVDTRIRRVEEGAFDAVVLAFAGVKRLGLEARIAEVLSPEVMLPAVGQGALAIEARTADAEVNDLLALLDDAETRAAVAAERSLLAALEGGCQVPLGAWARIEDGTLVLEACVCALDGSEVVRDRAAGQPGQAEALGRRLAKMLLDAGAGRLLRLAGRQI